MTEFTYFIVMTLVKLTKITISSHFFLMLINSVVVC